jgi:hypothetical protein
VSTNPATSATISESESAALKSLIYDNCLVESDRLLQCKADARAKNQDLTAACKSTATRLAACIAGVICVTEKDVVNQMCRDQPPGQPLSADCLAALDKLDQCFKRKGFPSPMHFRGRN